MGAWFGGLAPACPKRQLVLAGQQQGEYDAVAAQVDGYAEVVVKDKDGREVLAKVPTGQTLRVLQVDGTQAKVRWNDVEGFIKVANVKPVGRAQLPEQPLATAWGGEGGQQVPYDAYAKQVDGHPDVALKDKDGRVLTKIPNWQAVKVVQLNGDQVKLKWKEHEGFAKAVNIKPGVAGAAGLTPVEQLQQTAIAKQVDNFPEVVLKKDGGVIAKIPNGEEVKIVRQDGEDSLVRWNVYEGWAKSVNLQQMATHIPYSAADPTPRAPVNRGQNQNFGGPTVTPKPTPHALPPGQSCGNLFVCGQITDEIRKLLVDLKPQSMRASMPKFNLPVSGGPIPEGLTQYDIPCFGPALTEVVTTMLNVEAVQKQAADLRFMLPRCSINEVIQHKNKERGPQLVEEIRRAGGDAAAVKKLEQFVAKIGKLAAPDFVGADGKPRTDGKSWIDEFCPSGWKAKLHVNEVLTNFGFSMEFCGSFKTRPLKAGSRDTWTDFAVRWLSKAFDIFSYQGSMSDVVNLIFAMLNKHEPKPDIATVVQTVKDFTEILRKKEWHKIVWKPTYIIHDSELDDMLAWLLCCTIGSQTGSNMYCSVQMPPSERILGQLDHFQAQYESRSAPTTGITVFRDPSSRNRDKMMYCACFVPPRFVYLVSETEMRSFVGKYEWHQESNMFWSGQRRLYINPATGYWCISLDVEGMKKGYHQIRALIKGCIPHTNLGWRMLVQTENNPDNTKVGVISQQKWGEGNTNGRKAKWQDLTSEGEPILPNGMVKPLPEATKPVFQFWVSEDPREHPESPPLCLYRTNGPPCRQNATCDGWTRCAMHKRENDRQNQSCPVYIQARKYLHELNVDEFIDHKYDHCWCLSCHPANKDDIIQDPANRQQMCIVPRGWVAFGVVVSRHLREAGFEDIWKWPNTFHGTRGDLAQAILRHGHIGMPGDRMTDGSTLKSQNCAGRQDNNKFYTSPTAAYAGLQLYARPRKSKHMPGIVGQVVLQCNQNREPGNILKEQGETMKFRDNNFPPHGVCKQIPLYSTGAQAIEVISEKPDLCVIRRLLIRTFPENDPPTKSKSREVKPIAGNYEQFRSPVDAWPGISQGDGCLWL